MAKSKNGGTRAYIRGRIGSDVYSVGKNGKGERQQVVRSLAEMVSNPRTESQMFGRMIMSTTMQAVSAMAMIIDHSFDGFPKGQPSISEFIRQNYALIKADALAHAASGNKFGLNKYQEKGLKAGKYVISQGHAVAPAAVTLANGAGDGLAVDMGAGTTYADLKAAWGLEPDEFITLIWVDEASTYTTDGKVSFNFCRLSIKENLTPATVVTAANALDAFDLDGNAVPHVSLSDGKVSFLGAYGESTFLGFDTSIISRKENGVYIHNTATIGVAGSPKFASDDALPTYPTGAETFLNGGDL